MHYYAAYNKYMIMQHTSETIPAYSWAGPLRPNTSVFKKVLTWDRQELRRVFVDRVKESTTLIH